VADRLGVDMPTKRKVRTRKRWSASISEVAWRFLNDVSTLADRDGWEHFFLTHNDFDHAAQYRTEDLWRLYGEEITSEWIKDQPGTRPRTWWHFSSPRKSNERGKRDRYPVTEPRRVIEGPKPAFDYGGELGIPVFRFRMPRHREPALIESQASYLRRFDLLTPTEARQLTPADFEPETIEV